MTTHYDPTPPAPRDAAMEAARELFNADWLPRLDGPPLRGHGVIARMADVIRRHFPLAEATEMGNRLRELASDMDLDEHDESRLMNLSYASDRLAAELAEVRKVIPRIPDWADDTADIGRVNYDSGVTFGMVRAALAAKESSHG